MFLCDSSFVHEWSANFRSLFAHFLWFFVKTTRHHKIFAENCDIFVILNTASHFWCKIPTEGQGGATFNFRPILADFHEYILNMASYHVTEAINGYF